MSLSPRLLPAGQGALSLLGSLLHLPPWGGGPCDTHTSTPLHTHPSQHHAPSWGLFCTFPVGGGVILVSPLSSKPEHLAPSCGLFCTFHFGGGPCVDPHPAHCSKPGHSAPSWGLLSTLPQEGFQGHLSHRLAFSKAFRNLPCFALVNKPSQPPVYHGGLGC